MSGERSMLLRRHGPSALLILTWAGAISAPALSTALAPKSRQGVGEAAQTAASPLVSLASQGLTFAVLAACALLVAGRLAPLARPGVWRLMVVLAPWAYLFVRDFATGAMPTARTVLFAAVVTALWATRPDRRHVGVLGRLVVVTAGISLALGVLVPSAGLFHNDTGLVAPAKEVLPVGLLVGIFSHPNTLGQFLALGLPLVATIRHATTRWAGIAVTLLALAWTGSRTSLLAVLVGGAIVVGVGLTPHALRVAAATVSLGLVMVSALAVPYLAADPAAFTNRGYIWRSSLRRAGEDLWFGLGPQWYGDVGKTVLGLGPTVYHAHNQAIHARVTGGLLALALLVIVWLVAAAAAGRIAQRASLYAVGYLAVLAVISCFEVPLGFIDNTVLTPVVAAPLALVLFDPAGFAPPAGSR